MLLLLIKFTSLACPPHLMEQRNGSSPCCSGSGVEKYVFLWELHAIIIIVIVIDFKTAFKNTELSEKHGNCMLQLIL